MLGYAGQATEPGSDLQYLRARWYDPKTAQFLTRDPLEASTGQPYLYANGNPTMFSDPSGMSAQSLTDRITGTFDRITAGGTAAVRRALNGGCDPQDRTSEDYRFAGSVMEATAVVESTVLMEGPAAAELGIVGVRALAGTASRVRRAAGARRDAKLLKDAREARDALAKEVGPRKATVTGGYDPKTGRVAAGCNRNPTGCADDDVARQLGIPAKDIRFTEAIRPRTGEQVPVCHSCQAKYDRSQFPSGTRFREKP